VIRGEKDWENFIRIPHRSAQTNVKESSRCSNYILWKRPDIAQFVGSVRASFSGSEAKPMRYPLLMDVTADRPKIAAPEGRIEEMQLERLAGAVLSKSPADLAALAESNPLIVWEWIEEFRRQKVAAETEARYWAAAIGALATATPEAVPTAAE
jgi:hypothetical protein